MKLLFYLSKNFREFFYGYVNLLIFRIYHEAFTISSGGVMLSFLLGLYSQRCSLQKYSNFSNEK